jgi:hypothetical protein
MVTGGADFVLRFWDLNTMDSSFAHYREIEPDGAHIVNSIDFSVDSTAILLAQNTLRA